MQKLRRLDREQAARAASATTPTSRPPRADASHLSLVDGDEWIEPANDGRPWSTRSMLLLAGGVSVAIWGVIAWSASRLL
jgi:hypothetical protein